MGFIFKSNQKRNKIHLESRDYLIVACCDMTYSNYSRHHFLKHAEINLNGFETMLKRNPKLGLRIQEATYRYLVDIFSALYKETSATKQLINIIDLMNKIKLLEWKNQAPRMTKFIKLAKSALSIIGSSGILFEHGDKGTTQYLIENMERILLSDCSAILAKDFLAVDDMEPTYFMVMQDRRVFIINQNPYDDNLANGTGICIYNVVLSSRIDYVKVHRKRITGIVNKMSHDEQSLIIFINQDVSLIKGEEEGDLTNHDFTAEGYGNYLLSKLKAAQKELVSFHVVQYDKLDDKCLVSAFNAVKEKLKKNMR